MKLLIFWISCFCSCGWFLFGWLMFCFVLICNIGMTNAFKVALKMGCDYNFIMLSTLLHSAHHWAWLNTWAKVLCKAWLYIFSTLKVTQCKFCMWPTEVLTLKLTSIWGVQWYFVSSLGRQAASTAADTWLSLVHQGHRNQESAAKSVRKMQGSGTVLT